MIISGKKGGKIRKEWKFPCEVYRKIRSTKSMLCQFCKCWGYTKCNDISGIRLA